MKFVGGGRLAGATRRIRRRWLVGAILIGATALVGFLVTGPSPPRRITLATGQPGGMYDTFGGQYAARLRANGLDTVIVQSSGSLENLQRLLAGKVDVAFAQGGTYPLVSDPEGRLRSIAAVYREPLWIFHRGGPAVGSINELARRRLSIGLPGSGTEAVAAALLREHGIDVTAPNVVRLTNAEGRAQLEQGKLYAAFFVAGLGDPVVAGLMRRRDITLLGFRRDAAYARKFPALTPVRLYEGLLDLRHNLPAEDKILLAPAAVLACRTELHPRVVEQILKVAQAIHSPGSLLDAPQRYPNREGLDLPLHEAADVYLTQGESFLSRMLPYPLLRWTLLLRVLLVSLILWVPLLRFLPEVVGYRANRRFSRLYTSLRDAERQLEAAEDPDALHVGLAGLDQVAREAQSVCDKVPASRQRDVYDWRLHVAFVRAQATTRLAALESGSPSPAGGNGREGVR